MKSAAVAAAAVLALVGAPPAAAGQARSAVGGALLGAGTALIVAGAAHRGPRRCPSPVSHDWPFSALVVDVVPDDRGVRRLLRGQCVLLSEFPTPRAVLVHPGPGRPSRTPPTRSRVAGAQLAIVGAVAAAAGAALLFAWPRGRPPPVSVSAGPGGVSVAGSLRW